MGAILLLLLLIVPIVELWVIVQVSGEIGVLPTIGLLILVSVAGAALLKQQGLQTWERMQVTLRRGEMPTQEASDGALILLGGALLLTPGFVTDIVGLLLVIPFTRAFVKKSFRTFLSRRIRTRYGVGGPRKAPGTYETKVVKVERNSSPRERGPDSPSLPRSGPDDAGGSPDRG